MTVKSLVSSLNDTKARTKFIKRQMSWQANFGEMFTRENPSGITHEEKLEHSTWRDTDVDLSSSLYLLN